MICRNKRQKQSAYEYTANSVIRTPTDAGRGCQTADKSIEHIKTLAFILATENFDIFKAIKSKANAHLRGLYFIYLIAGCRRPQ